MARNSVSLDGVTLRLPVGSELDRGRHVVPHYVTPVHWKHRIILQYGDGRRAHARCVLEAPRDAMVGM